MLVRFMNLDKGPFRTIREEEFETSTAALAAVKAYAEAAGYSNVKIVDDGEEPDSIRFTAKTPGGRGGRNVAFGDW